MSVKRLIAEAKRSGRTRLDLSRRNLTAVPEAVRGLAHLTELDLSVNGITRLPEWIGELRALTSLNLYGNRLAALPESIGGLERLVWLNVGDNQLTALPASIGRLGALTRLDLDLNRITALPGSLGRLTRLSRLDLFRNRLTDLPVGLERLQALTWLDAGHNRFGTLPAPITALTGLTWLELSRIGLTELPDAIGRLVNLIHLGLGDNRLRTLPRSIAALTALDRLNLNGNQFKELPEHIGALTELTRLDAEGNGLRTLPRSLFRLEKLAVLHLDGNLLSAEQRGAAETGLPELRKLIERTDVEGADSRESKLVLVGEGEVGKSSLLAAMRGEPFDPDRGSTHGIEVKTLELAGPTADPATAIALNAWDFGGQKAYRPTHQLFFTAPAVYVVVWKARQGPMQGFVDYWIDLIRRRTTDANVKVHIVATHVDAEGQHPKIDQAGLRERHGDLLGGFHFVDSATGTGIADLKAALWDSAAAMPQLEREVPASWRNLRRSLIESGESYLEYDAYERRADAFGLDADAARALARIATQLGYWIHYPEIPGLDDIVVLKGDWLSTAVSLVLDDPATAGANGLVAHPRLGDLWDDPGRGPRYRYDPKFHPALVQLMEKYDISYRIAREPGRPESSLIAQLLDEAPPPLDEVWDAFGPRLARDAQLCEFLDANGAKAVPEGLMHQLIVRWHRRSLGRERFEDSVHWHSGFVIEPDPFSRALVRLEGQRLRIEVKAVYPEQFLHEFVQDLEAYAGELWPGLRLKRLVPCAGVCIDPNGSEAGLFGMERLLSRRRLGKKTAECRRCWQDVPIDGLLHRRPADDEPDEAPDAPQGRDAIEQWTQTQEELRKIIGLLSDEAVQGPRFYTVELRDKGSWAKRLTHVGIRVVLWCEHSQLPLYVLDGDPSSGVFDIDVPREWLLKSAPLIRRTLKVLWSTVLPGGSVALDLLMPSFDPAAIENHLELAEESFKVIAEIGEDALAAAAEQPWATGAGSARSGAELRRLHAFLNKADPGYGGLERVQDRGRFLWVHRRFAGEYEPGVPTFDRT
ncbi:COR domain-containing protein [Glycomyces sp. NPDC047369]